VQQCIASSINFQLIVFKLLLKCEIDHFTVVYLALKNKLVDATYKNVPLLQTTAMPIVMMLLKKYNPPLHAIIFQI